MNQVTACLKCGAGFEPEDRFCGECGARRPENQELAAADKPENDPSSEGLQNQKTPVATAAKQQATPTPKSPEAHRYWITAGVFVVLVGILIVAALSDKNNVEQRTASSGSSTSVARPSTSAGPPLTIAEPGRGARVCDRSNKCGPARGRMNIGDFLISNTDWSIVDIMAPTGRNLPQSIKGRVLRAELSANERNSVYLYLSDGTMEGSISGITLYFGAGGGFCSMSSGSYSIRKFTSVKQSRVTLKSGSAECRDPKGKTRRLTTSNPRFVWNNN